ncbi:MAG: hypothetical protein OXG25_00010 [Gammaproteobacteria bacterium]|nr:hypothetical protein [Gammaproteobacteria bacterium]
MPWTASASAFGEGEEGDSGGLGAARVVRHGPPKDSGPAHHERSHGCAVTGGGVWAETGAGCAAGGWMG